MIDTNVNIEVVRGCKNVDCRSWQTTCNHNGPLKEMSLKELKDILIELSKHEITNIGLYGRGESLYHSKLQDCFDLVKEIIPSTTTILNIDGNMINKGIPLPKIDYLIILHKEKITHPVSSDIDHIGKIRHSFLVSKITLKLLDEIDEYIDKTINLNVNTEYVIGTLWDIEFGSPPKIGTFKPLEVEDGIDLYIPKDISRYPRRKIYIDIDGVVRKCLFSYVKYSTISDLLSIPGNNCNCEGCGMDVFSYKLNLKEGGES